MSRPRKIQPVQAEVQRTEAESLMIECLWHSIGTNRGKLAQGGVGEIDADEVEIMETRAAEGKVRFL